ncbi:MAG: PQQ-dependent dehydrogenase, methanol/ethanol family, partial [candidate division NC10 bacterium]|nr:PQQ-dependent dehydrogenase, methanol/ethanol family [candidate division NC10 bacterium]
MSVKRCTSLIGGLLILVGGLVVTAPMASANDELVKLQKDDGQWAQQGKNYAATRYSGLNQITSDNVKNLKV